MRTYEVFEITCPCGRVYQLPNDHMNIQCKACGKVLILNWGDVTKPQPAPQPISNERSAA